MPITQSGALNTTALTVPNIYVQIIPPAVAINGVASNKLGIVGSAVWGPVGIPIAASNLAGHTTNFGPAQARKYDLGTQVAIATQQGANNLALVRWTDGTDAAATIAVLTNCITFTARYTGTLGNTIIATVATGSKGTGYFKVTVTIGGTSTPTFPTQVAEVFDNLAFGLSGNAVWLAIAAAINNGVSLQRGPSRYITATAGAGTTAPSLAAYTLTGGVDGASTATAVAASPAIAYGVDTVPRTGMYALRSSACAILVVADLDTSTAWTTIDGFAASEGMYAIQCGPAGDTISNAVTTFQSAGVAGWTTKFMFGDWVYWNDPVNQIIRLVSPQSFIGGEMAAMAPNQTTLNKKLYGVLGTQKTGLVGTPQQQTYASADLQSLFAAGICVIGNPSPGGPYFSDLLGHNSSTNAGTQSDQYSRMTNYLAATLAGTMGQYVGQPITPTLYNNITGSLNQFCGALLSQNLISLNADGSLPYVTLCNGSNNPQSRTSLGYVQADVAITYQGINEKFIVNLNAGSGVVTVQPGVSGQN